MKRYQIKNIRRGAGPRRDFIYAELHDTSQPEGQQLSISATIDYILDVIEAHDYDCEQTEERVK